jgi:dolichol-phosphate mannosyltransferase
MPSTTTLLPPIDEPKNIEKASVGVLLPTYCEAENIESLLQDIERLNLNILIAVIDDSSPDGTAERVMRLQEKYGNVHLVSRSEKLGLGTAITIGFRYMLNLEKVPDYIVTMDADYSHNPKDIPRLLDVAKKRYDLVIGSRYVQNGEVIGASLRRRVISRLANVIASITVGARLHDCTSGFRCYSKRYVKDVLPNLHCQTYEIQIETVRQARLTGFRIKEVPITFLNRKHGKSKLTAIESRGFITYIVKALLGNLLLLRKLAARAIKIAN